MSDAGLQRRKERSGRRRQNSPWTLLPHRVVAVVAVVILSRSITRKHDDCTVIGLNVELESVAIRVWVSPTAAMLFMRQYGNSDGEREKLGVCGKRVPTEAKSGCDSHRMVNASPYVTTRLKGYSGGLGDSQNTWNWEHLLLHIAQVVFHPSYWFSPRAT